MASPRISVWLLKLLYGLLGRQNGLGGTACKSGLRYGTEGQRDMRTAGQRDSGTEGHEDSRTEGHEDSRTEGQQDAACTAGRGQGHPWARPLVLLWHRHHGWDRRDSTGQGQPLREPLRALAPADVLFINPCCTLESAAQFTNNAGFIFPSCLQSPSQSCAADWLLVMVSQETGN